MKTFHSFLIGAAVVAVLAGALTGIPVDAGSLAGLAAPDGAPALDLSEVGVIGIGGLIINQANLQDLFRGFKASFNTGFRSVETFWMKVATAIPSTTKEEKYTWLGQWPRLREWVGDRHLKSLAAHDYSIRNKKYEATISVPKDDIDDDTYGIFTPLFAEMGFAAATHPDELVFALLKNGFATLAYDGQYFFDTDHPVGSASVSNMQAGGGNPWFLLDVSRPLKPLIFQRRREYDLKSMTDRDDEAVFMRDEFRYGVDARVNVGFGFWQQAFGSKATLDETNFDSAYEAMLALKSDEDRPLGIKANLLVVGPTNRKQALEIVQAERKADGATNLNRGLVDVAVVPWLD